MNTFSRRNPRVVVLCLLLGAGFAAVAVLVKNKQLAAFDAAVIRWVQDWENPALTRVMKFFTRIGTGLPEVLIAFAAILVLYLVFRRWREILVFLVVVIGSGVLNTLLKVLFHMNRPDFHRLIVQGGYGFPSGHAMGALSLYGATVVLLWPRIRNWPARIAMLVMAVLVILAIGLSRIYLGVHFPSDVLGGYLAAGCWLSGCVWVYHKK